ncbi:hypothetical protein AVEN_21651-1, partial [Araneus ventricosus]
VSAIFAISGFPHIDIFIVHNRDVKIATKTYIANNQDVCLPVSKMPQPLERSPINLVSYYKNNIITKTYIANNQNVCLPVSKMPHLLERSPINLVSYHKNIEDNFLVVCFTDGSKINSKVGLAFVVFQYHIETEVHQFRIVDECSVFQAELLCIAQSVN